MDSCLKRKASQFYVGHIFQDESCDLNELSYVTCNMYDINGVMSQKKGVTILFWSHVSE